MAKASDVKVSDEEKLLRKRMRRSAKRTELTLSQRDYLLHYLETNRPAFARVMTELEKTSPVLFARFYLDACKMVMPKDQNINVNVGLRQDYMELQALAGMNVQTEGTDAVRLMPADECVTPVLDRK